MGLCRNQAGLVLYTIRGEILMMAELALKSTLWLCNYYKSDITCLSSEPVQSPFANLEPPRKTFTHRFRDEVKSFLFKDTGVAGCRKIS